MISVIEKFYISVTDIYVVVKTEQKYSSIRCLFLSNYVDLSKICPKLLSSYGIRESRKDSDRLITSKRRVER